MEGGVTFKFLTVSHAFCPLPEIHALPPLRGSIWEGWVNLKYKIMEKGRKHDDKI
jgi:hypothetical protein